MRFVTVIFRSARICFTGEQVRSVYTDIAIGGHMRLWWLAVIVCLCAPAPARADPPALSCVRFVQPDQRWILDEGIRDSPTMRKTAEALCETDVIAYVRIDLQMRTNVAGSCALLTSTLANRMLSIRLSNRLIHGVDLIATLSHELEHALEIGRASWVRRPADVLTLQHLLAPDGSHAPGPVMAERNTRRELWTARAMARRP